MRREFDTPGSVRLRLTIGAGGIEIDTADTDRTEVEITAHGRNADDVLAELTVTGEERGGVFEIVVEEPKRGLIGLFRGAELQVRVRCPNGSEVEAQTGS